MTTQPPNPTLLTPSELHRQAQYKSAIHYTSLGALLLSPALIFVPPRTTFRTTILLLFTGIGANQLADEYSGSSLLSRAKARISYIADTTALPSERAREVQARLREERHAQRIAREGDAAAASASTSLTGRLAGSTAGKATSRVGITEEEKGVVNSKQESKGVLEKVWMGGEGEDWKQQRDRKEKEALEEGRGYGGLIADQIWEVWNWGRGEVEKVREVDERVVAEERRRKEEEKREEK